MAASADFPAPPRAAALRRRSARRARALRGDQDGSATVEFVLWAPVLLAMLMSMADLALIFTTNADMQHAARETARGLARRQVTAAGAPGFARDRLSLGDRDAYAFVISDGPEVEVRISLPSNTASVFGFYELLMPGDLVAHAVMRREDPA